MAGLWIDAEGVLASKEIIELAEEGEREREREREREKKERETTRISENSLHSTNKEKEGCSHKSWTLLKS